MSRMSCSSYCFVKRMAVTSSRCKFRPKGRAHIAIRSHFNHKKILQSIATQVTADHGHLQLSLTEYANNRCRERPATSEPSRRAMLAHGAVLCSLAALADLPLDARPSAAAALVDEDVATFVFQAVIPSVASIAIVRSVGGVQVREVVGSGVIWDAVGPHVLTNFHVIPPLQGTSALLEVTLQATPTGSFITLPARVTGSDSLHDLAVLRLLPQVQPGEGAAAATASATEVRNGGNATATGGAPGGLPTVVPIRAAVPGDLRVGQFVYALGCVASDPAAPTRSLSAGLLSGLGRSIPSPVGARIYGVIQTEAVVNAANSGGPLVDSLGRMVGLNTAVGAARSSTARGSGVSFALPMDLLLDLVPKIIVYGNPYGKK